LGDEKHISLKIVSWVCLRNAGAPHSAICT
jgi:hypothetical protein